MDDDLNEALSGLPPFPKSLRDAIDTSNDYHRGPHHQSYINLMKIQERYDSISPRASDTDYFLRPSTAITTQQEQRMKNDNRHDSLSSTQTTLSDRENNYSRASNLNFQSYYHKPVPRSPLNNPHLHQDINTSNSSNFHNKEISINKELKYSPMTKLDAQLAVVKLEMCNLRQLDLTLLSQLWALNESIQAFRMALEEQEAMCLPSPTHSEPNSRSSETEDGSCCAPPASQTSKMSHDVSSITSHKSSSSQSASSSAASLMSKQHDMFTPPVPSQVKSHPQLPIILQQRTRRAPPPPTPTSNRFQTSHSTPLTSQAVFPKSILNTTSQARIKSSSSPSPSMNPGTSISTTLTQQV